MNNETEHLRLLTNISTNILMNCNIQGLITYCNKRCAFLFPQSGLNGSRLENIFDIANANEIKRNIVETIVREMPHSIQIKHNRRYYNIYMYPDKNSAALCIEDITERRQLSDLLSATNERMKFAEHTAKLGYWEMDLKAKKIFWSEEMFNIFGVRGQNISVKKNIIKQQALKEDLPLYKEKLRQLVKDGKPVEGMLRIKRGNGTIAHCFFKAKRIINEDTAKIAGTFQDLTGLIEIQLALEAAKAAAERLNRAKSSFLAQASHDLRQPMQALAIFIDTLMDEPLSDEQFSLVKKIHASAENLRNLLDNLLDISKLEAGGVEAHPQHFNIGKLLSGILQEYSHIAEKRRIKLNFVPCCKFVDSDPILLERIIRNYLSNAFKYAKSKILVGCRQLKNTLKIMVIDDGAGITPEETGLVFEEFYQSSDIPNNKKNGSGLGLTIVKRIADILQVKTSVKSRKGKGSCFYIEIKTTPEK